MEQYAGSLDYCSQWLASIRPEVEARLAHRAPVAPLVILDAERKDQA